MEAQFKREDFTVTKDQLAEANGVVKNCINAWANEGAFPYAGKNKQAKKVQKLFHTSCLTMTAGEIKRNRKAKKFKDPMFFMADYKPSTEAIYALQNRVEFLHMVQENNTMLKTLLSNLGVQSEQI